MKARQLSLQPNIGWGNDVVVLPLHFWLAVILIGIGAGIAGIAFMALLHAVQHGAWSYTTGNFLSATEMASFVHRWIVLVAAGCFVGLVRKFLRSTTGGHGGEIAKSIWIEAARIPFWPTLAKCGFSIIVVGLGAALGREGAPKQTGAAFGSVLASYFKMSADQRRLLTACGAGAGIAAVYNVPIGGALFACEVLLGQISLPLALPALVASSIATLVSWLALSNQSTYTTVHHSATTEAFVAATVMGIASGFAATVYVRCIAWADARKPKGWRTFVIPVVVFALLAGAATFFPGVLGNGKDEVQLAFNAQMNWRLLAMLLVLRPIATAACLSSGAPGGLFTPTLTVGALLGGTFGAVIHFMHASVEPGEWAILGSAAFLAAASKGPLSALVLIMELIGHLNGLALPLMWAIAVASLVSQRLEGRSIYSARIHQSSKGKTSK